MRFALFKFDTVSQRFWNLAEKVNNSSVKL